MKLLNEYFLIFTKFCFSVVLQRYKYNKSLCALIINGYDRHRRKYHYNHSNEGGKLTAFVIGAALTGVAVNGMSFFILVIY